MELVINMVVPQNMDIESFNVSINKNKVYIYINTLFHETFTETMVKHNETYSTEIVTCMFHLCFKFKISKPIIISSL